MNLGQLATLGPERPHIPEQTGCGRHHDRSSCVAMNPRAHRWRQTLLRLRQERTSKLKVVRDPLYAIMDMTVTPELSTRPTHSEREGGLFLLAGSAFGKQQAKAV